MKPAILQMGAYPDWDEAALDESYDVRRYHQAASKADFLAASGPMSTPSPRGASLAPAVR
jgi:hypothetical protein